MAKKTAEIVEEKTNIVRIEDTTLDENQLSDQLYNSAGLDPIVDAGIKDYEHKIQLENKVINKIFGIRESDIRGYGASVAKRVALAIYTLLNKQYGGKVGDMRSYIMSLEEERDRANTRYDDLMGRVIGTLGDEYKELRTDSVAFIEKLTREQKTILRYLQQGAKSEKELKKVTGIPVIIPIITALTQLEFITNELEFTPQGEIIATLLNMVPNL